MKVMIHTFPKKVCYLSISKLLAFAFNFCEMRRRKLVYQK